MDRRTFLKTGSASAAITAGTAPALASSHNAAQTKPQRWPIIRHATLPAEVIDDLLQPIGTALEIATAGKHTLDTGPKTGNSTTRTAHQPSPDSLFVTRADFDPDNFPELAILAADRQTAPSKEQFASWLWLSGGAEMLQRCGAAKGYRIHCLTHSGIPARLEGQDLPDEIAYADQLNLNEGIGASVLSRLATTMDAQEGPPLRRHITELSIRKGPASKVISDPFARHGVPLLLFVPDRFWTSIPTSAQRAMADAIDATYARGQAILSGLARASANATARNNRTHLTLPLQDEIARETRAVAEELAARSALARMIHDSLFAEDITRRNRTDRVSDDTATS